MDYSYSQGELGEVVRASRVKQPPLHRDDEPNNNQTDSSWSFPSSSDLVMDFHQEETTTNYDCFGNNPFAVSTSRDTNNELLQEICMPTTTSFLISNNSDRTNSAAAADPMNATTSAAAPEDAKGGYFCSEDRQASGGRRVVEEEGIFAGMLRISSSSNNTAKAYKPFDVTTYGGSAVLPSPSPREVVKQAPFLSADHMIINEGSSVRISSPQTSYAKRRKKEAKKVICVPAPPPSNGKSSGEVVPPDLWAWRKYGQKPIKGSPYPRGYYRCSSSKGCPARKQVEKSRNDPNMLVVTYTCEHNHAWPTQRNALAGSTRAQPNAPSKTNAASSSSNPKSSPSSSNSQVEKDLNNQESNKESINVKEEETRIVGIDHPQMNVDGDEFNDGGYRIQVSDQMEMALESNQFSEDFFADLGEIEKTSSIDDLLLNPGKSIGEDGNECKAIDPIFSFLDWSSGT